MVVSIRKKRDGQGYQILALSKFKKGGVTLRTALGNLPPNPIARSKFDV
jgi:hypothetical protein